MSASSLGWNFTKNHESTTPQLKFSSAFVISQALKGVMGEICQDDILLIKIECRRCSLVFYLCRSCYRGHAYCCDFCRKTARRDAHRIAQSKYRTSDKGRKNNLMAAKKRRIKQSQKSVADRGSIPLPKNAIMPQFFLSEETRCLFCCVSGTVVARFPRRGYQAHSFKHQKHRLKLDKAWVIQHQVKDRRHYEYQKNIRPRPNSQDP